MKNDALIKQILLPVLFLPLHLLLLSSCETDPAERDLWNPTKPTAKVTKRKMAETVTERMTHLTRGQNTVTTLTNRHNKGGDGR